MDAELVKADESLRITISDTGTGVPPDLREKILSPFFTTKATGTGLGLPIARGIIHGHQGELHVDDRPGGGARSVVDFSLQPSP